MAEVIDRVIATIVWVYNSVKDRMPGQYGLAFDALVLGILIVIIAMFIWQFYRSMSRRNLFVLNLNKYNKTKHPVLNKTFATLIYIVEYLLIMPFIILLWFAALVFILLLITEQAVLGKVLLITAAMVMGVRILAYHNEAVAQDLSKMFPFIALSLFLLSPEKFDFNSVVGHLSQLGALFSNVLWFLVAIYVVEIFFRLLYTIKALILGEDIGDSDDTGNA